jgi:hypothetical protein
VVLVSRAPLARLQAYQQRLGWRLPWVSSANSDFNVDFGASSNAELDPPPVEGGLPPHIDRLSQEQRSYTACKRGCARW